MGLPIKTVLQNNAIISKVALKHDYNVYDTNFSYLIVSLSALIDAIVFAMSLSHT